MSYSLVGETKLSIGDKMTKGEVFPLQLQNNKYLFTVKCLTTDYSLSQSEKLQLGGI